MAKIRLCERHRLVYPQVASLQQAVVAANKVEIVGRKHCPICRREQELELAQQGGAFD